MNIYTYAIKIFNKVITAVGFDVDDIAKNYPGAESITLTGTCIFIGDGSTTPQTLTKATPTPSIFTGSSGENTGSSHIAIPDTVDITVVKPSSIVFAGPASALAYVWEMDGQPTVYGQNASLNFENAGTYVMKLTCASDGGQTASQYMKIMVT